MTYKGKYFYFIKVSLIAILLIAITSVNAQVRRKHKAKHTTIQRHKAVTHKKASAKRQTVTKKVTVASKPAASADTTELPEDISGKNFTVTSSFTPVLRESSKINFSNSSSLPAAGKVPLSYNVPAQNLTFTYRPAYLRPLAANIDTASVWRNTDFLKLGYGNYSSLYIEGSYSFGDGYTSAVTLHAKHTPSKGSLPLQQFSNTDIDASGTFTAGEDN